MPIRNRRRRAAGLCVGEWVGLRIPSHPLASGFYQPATIGRLTIFGPGRTPASSTPASLVRHVREQLRYQGMYFVFPELGYCADNLIAQEHELIIPYSLLLDACFSTHYMNHPDHPTNPAIQKRSSNATPLPPRRNSDCNIHGKVS